MAILIESERVVETMEIPDPPMSWLFRVLLIWILPRCSAKAADRELDMALEIAVLRHQLAVLRRKTPKPRFTWRDRLAWILFSRCWEGWKRACVLVKPETVIGWHRRFRLFWRWKSRRRPGGKRISPDVVALIRRMAAENPTWVSPRIHGELSKLGFRVSERTVLRHIPKREGTDGQRQAWRTFLANHREVLAAMSIDPCQRMRWRGDFLVVPTLAFRQLYVLVILHHGRRIIAHVNVTAHPTAEWVRQQLREAFPFDAIPRYLIFDRDRIFGATKDFIRSLGITPKQTAFHCPWQNGAVERFNGTLRRELLDRVIVLNEAHLRRLLKELLAYYHDDRTHLALGKDAPRGRLEEFQPRASAAVDALPRVGGLHHRYVWRDAA